MFGKEEIKKHNIAQQRHLMTMFGDDSIEKAISTEEFAKSYGETHTIFSKKNIEEYQLALAAMIEDDATQADSLIEKAVAEFEPLQKVLVKNDNAVETFYVKKNEVAAEEEEG